jgi:hypothetical protein
VPEDWLSRVVIPDLYPRREDPLRPAPAVQPQTAPPASMLSDEPPPGDLTVNITTGGARPLVVQDALNYSIPLSANTAAPLVTRSMMVDAIGINVPSTAAVSAFFGRGAVTNVSGWEVRPGSPQLFRADNTREIWELQRTLEYIAALLAADRGGGQLPSYRAPRVAFDASQYSLFATAAVTVAIMLFYIPVQQ